MQRVPRRRREVIEQPAPQDRQNADWLQLMLTVILGGLVVYAVLLGVHHA